MRIALKIATRAALRCYILISLLSLSNFIWVAKTSVLYILNQFEGVMTPYTFIALDLGPSTRTCVTLQHNISSSWDHHRNYPLMPIHKSVGHFQSTARNSRRNTAAVHSNTDATSAATVAFGHTYTNFVPSPGTNIRVSFSTIRGHEQRKERRLDSSRRIFPL